MHSSSDSSTIILNLRYFGVQEAGDLLFPNIFDLEKSCNFPIQGKVEKNKIISERCKTCSLVSLWPAIIFLEKGHNRMRDEG